MFSFASTPGCGSPQLLEIENDLIGSYFFATGHAPLLQFGQEGVI
jgi:hypothetical protein